MKTYFKLATVVSMTLIILSSFKVAPTEELADGIQWLSFEEAVLKMDDEPRKMFIDVYTDWCGWCKKMDGSTFQDAKVIKELNTHFYAVKLNAEQKEEIVFNGHTFKFVDQGRRGYHELAGALLNGKLSYPSFVLMNEKMEVIQPLPGYKTAEQLTPILSFIGEDHYLETDWNSYLQSYKAN